MNANRYGFFTGLVFMLPVLAWLLVHNPSQMEGAEWHIASRTASSALYISLVIALSLFIPWHSHHYSWRDNTLAALLIILISLPLMVLIWLSASITTSFLYKGLIALILYFILINTLSKIIQVLRLSNNWLTILRASVQLILSSLAWAYSSNWLSWIGI